MKGKEFKVIPDGIQLEEQFLNQNQINPQIPTQVEKQFVYEVYDKIAPHFSNTRYKPWPQVVNFIKNIEKGSIVCDIGCGNGKYMNQNDDLIFIGTDRSIGLLECAKQSEDSFQLFAADSLKLPLRNNSIDYIISIAVIHHFSNENMRIQAINEMLRILKKDGQILIYVWAFEQEQRKFESQDIYVPWNLQYKYEDKQTLDQLQNIPSLNEDMKNLEMNEKALDEQRRTVVYKRYYHVFKEGELEKLLEQIKNIKIIKSYYDHANWCAIIQKII